MDLTAIIAVVVIVVVQLLLIRPMDRYIVQTYYKERSRFDALFGPVERLLFRALGVNPNEGMTAKRYIGNLLLVNLCIGYQFFSFSFTKGPSP